MNLYAESSAVLSWLLGESASEAVADAFASAGLVVSSTLTVVECDRALIRGTIAGRWTEGDAQDRRRVIASVTGGWHLLAVSDEILERSRRSFPAEPLRTLDSLHLSSALVARSVLPDLALLSLDSALRENARRLGFAVVPE